MNQSTSLEPAPANIPGGRERFTERTGGVWAYVSASRLNAWLACPLKFQLRYIDGLTTPPTGTLVVGQAVHAALEAHYRHRQLGLLLAPEDIVRRLRADWGERAAAGVFASAADEAACQEQAVGLVTAYLAAMPAEEPRPLAVETALEAPLIDPRTGEDLGIPLVGILDLVLAESAGPLIADFKTTSRGGEPLELAHEIQLSCYSYLFRRTHAQPEAALEIRNLVKTKTPKVERHRYAARTPQHNGRLFTVVRAYLDAVDRGRFSYRPGLHCAACEFQTTHCRVWAG